MKFLLQKADRFWDDLACGVDWYRDHASPEIAERFVDAIEVTLAGLLRTPEQAGFGSRNGRNWLAFVLSAFTGRAICQEGSVNRTEYYTSETG